MLSLHTNLTLETIQKSKVLQKIKCEKYYTKVSGDIKTWDEWMEIGENTILSKLYPAPTIADVISNAEKLFRHPMITNQEILIKCYQNKPLADIEEIILNNLK